MTPKQSCSGLQYSTCRSAFLVALLRRSLFRDPLHPPAHVPSNARARSNQLDSMTGRQCAADPRRLSSGRLQFACPTTAHGECTPSECCATRGSCPGVWRPMLSCPLSRRDRNTIQNPTTSLRQGRRTTSTTLADTEKSRKQKPIPVPAQCVSVPLERRLPSTTPDSKS